MSQLEDLQKLTTIVADTGEFEAIKKYTPTDATTNPSLIFKAAQQPEYRHVIEKAVSDVQQSVTDPSQMMDALLDRLMVAFGTEILNIVPGRVSTEVDARLSFDIQGSIDKGRKLIQDYEKAGVSRDRILIKLASTWEGVEAARVLEKEGIHCNMTLMFCLAQAIACAEAGATLISPFVGRILDWFKKAEGVEGYPPEQDPGVLSVTKIFNYYKKFGFGTEVMGASFRNKDQITELAGCDLLTISPNLLEELSASSAPVVRKLDASKVPEMERIEITEASFRWHLNEDQMATEKLSDGIRSFASDTLKLEAFLQKNFLSKTAGAAS